VSEIGLTPKSGYAVCCWRAAYTTV